MKKLSLILAGVIALSLPVGRSMTQTGQAELIMGGVQSDKVVKPASVACDRSGNIYVYSKGTKEIVCFGKDMKLKFRSGGFGYGEEAFIDPQDILVTKDNILVSDVGMIKVFNLAGKFIKNIDKIKDTTLSKPAGLSLDPRGKIFVCDPDINKVFHLDPDLGLYKVYDNFKQPVSFLSVNDNYYVLERETGSAQLLSAMMAKIKTFSTSKTSLSMTTDGRQRIFIADGQEVKVFTLGGIPGKTYGIAPRSPEGDYCSIGIDANRIIVSSATTHELLGIDDSGKVSVLSEYIDNSLCLPEGLAVDENGRIFVNDSGNQTVKVIDQRGNNLYQIQEKAKGKIAISKDLLALKTQSAIKIFTRSGKKTYEIPETDVNDIDFDQDGSLLVLGKDSVSRFVGSTKTETIIKKQEWGQSTSISTIGTHFVVTDADQSKVILFNMKGDQINSISLTDPPVDSLLLSPQRIIICGESSLKLIDHNGKVLRSFGKPGGPFSLHEPDSAKISFESNLDALTEPVSLASFGRWLYILDRSAMRLVRYPRELLLEQPKIKVTPAIVDFKYVQPDSEQELEIVIQNVGGDSLDGYFTSCPKWISLSTKTVKGDEVIIKVKAKAYHFIPKMTYMESIVLESNAGRVEIPCILRTPESLPKQINVEFQIGNNTISVNGKNIDIGIPPYIKDNSTMVPLQFVSSAFSAAAEYDGSSGYVSINFPNKNIWVVCEVNSDYVTVQRDDQTSTMNMKPKPEIKSGKPCLPLSFFIDLLDCESYWDKATKKIRLIYLP
jgi:hypothetical protein